jgi:hypothetical protein
LKRWRLALLVLLVALGVANAVALLWLWWSSRGVP